MNGSQYNQSNLHCCAHPTHCAVRKSTFLCYRCVLAFVFPPRVILNLVPAISRHTENVWIVFLCYLSHSTYQISQYELCSRFPNFLMLTKRLGTEQRQVVPDMDQASLSCLICNLSAEHFKTNTTYLFSTQLTIINRLASLVISILALRI